MSLRSLTPAKPTSRCLCTASSTFSMDTTSMHTNDGRMCCAEANIARTPVRYGYDFMITNKAGDLYRGDRFVKENWFSYGAPVYATAAGTVVDAANDIPETSYQNGEVVSPPNLDAIDPTGSGNHVTLDHGDGEFSMFHHMKTGMWCEERRPRPGRPADRRNRILRRHLPTSSALHAG